MPALVRPLLVALLLAMLGFMAAASASRTHHVRAEKTAAKPAKSSGFADPAPAPVTQPAADVQAARPARPRSTPQGFRVVRVRQGRSILIHNSVNGRPVGRLASSTEFGSPEVLSVAKRRGRWLGVTTPAIANGKLAWIRGESKALERDTTRWSLRADLSRRRLELRNGGKLVRAMTVAIGRPGSTTPTGRFQVTDKLSGANYGAYYGCCILALSGHQPHTPPGWQGGNRLAIHGTNVAATIGKAASAGCLRAADRDLRVLMRRVPLGTPVFIRS
ncbi:MAG TPA: L,D-transpeptidase [Thermoleophilaceae bacterium]